MRTNNTSFICVSVLLALLFFPFFNNSNGSVNSVMSSAGLVDSILVIMNDSTVGASTLKRKADRDTLRKYIPMLVSKVRYITKDTNTVFPNLNNYSIIIYQETAWDDEIARALTASQRQAIKNWLAGGTPGAKRGLIMIGADLGYNYDRIASPYQDTTFSRTYGGFQFLVDNAATAATFASVGTAPGTNYNTMSITPPGSSYWPDGCRPASGGLSQVFNVYMNRTDTLAGISKPGPGWNVISTFQDPRYFTGTGQGTGDTGFKRVLKNMIAWVKVIGGCFVTTIEPVSEVANDYKLSQNYPNPFNPTTKISFSIPKSGFTTLKVYDILGKEVASLINGVQSAGNYVVKFNANDLVSGAYFYRLEVNGFVETKKMLLVK